MPILSSGDAAGALLPPGQSFGQAGLNVDAEPDFYLRHHPLSWAVDADGELVPVLDKLHKVPGLNCVDRHGDTTLAEAISAREGWTLIPLAAAEKTDTPDGRPGYVRGYPTARGGVAWVAAWQTPESIGGKVVWRSDQIGYRAWLKALVERGVIAPPSDVVIESVRQGLQSQLQQAEAQQAFSPVAAAKVAGLKAQIARLAQSAEATTPTPTTPKARKAAN